VWRREWNLPAAQLLRSGGARVVLIESGDRIGRGVAYGWAFAVTC
jgi:hypothetical protein